MCLLIYFHSIISLKLLYISFYLYFFKHFLKILFIYLFVFRERGMEGETEGEKHQCVAASYAPLTGDLAHNPGMCPAWESSR